MNTSKTRLSVGLLGLAFLLSSSTLLAGDSRPRVGKVALHNTGDPTAQQPFLDGLAALHSFWYEEARELFQQAQEADPGFAMAYWGEAMTHYHPIWRSTSNSGGRGALKKLDEQAGERLQRYGTEVEQALVEAARALFDGDGERAFARVLKDALESHPDSTEIAVFYALALQGQASSWGRRSEEDLRLIAESGAVLEKLLERHPRHPGVLHYLIHAYDDPEHAALARRAADTYTTVAPDASHALHMPSHIYVQVGDWEGVVASNRRAWAASETWVARRDLSESKKDFHALSWLHYGLLQQGDFRGADKVRETLRTNGGGHHGSHDSWAARRLIESEDWDRDLNEGSSRDEVTFARAYAAAHRGDLRRAKIGIKELTGSGETEILRLELEGLVAAAEGKSERAIAQLAKAAELEENTRIPSGPPDLVKPALELYGEVLLELGRCEEAAEAFERSLARMPGRRLSVRGAESTLSCRRSS
jgi:tetratricopeptide (TPR) repeat protein